MENGGRYRLTFENNSEDGHSLQVHRFTIRLTRINWISCDGEVKELVLISGKGKEG